MMRNFIIGSLLLTATPSFASERVESLLEDARNLRTLIYSNLVLGDEAETTYTVPKYYIQITEESTSAFSESTRNRVKFLVSSIGGIEKRKVTWAYAREALKVDDNRGHALNFKRFSMLKVEYIWVLSQLSAVAPLNIEFVNLVSNDSRAFVIRGARKEAIVPRQTANGLLRRSARVVCKDIIDSPGCDELLSYVPHAESSGLYFSRQEAGNDGKGYDVRYF